MSEVRSILTNALMRAKSFSDRLSSAQGLLEAEHG